MANLSNIFHPPCSVLQSELIVFYFPPAAECSAGAQPTMRHRNISHLNIKSLGSLGTFLWLETNYTLAWVRVSLENIAVKNIIY